MVKQEKQREDGADSQKEAEERPQVPETESSAQTERAWTSRVLLFLFQEAQLSFAF